MSNKILRVLLTICLFITTFCYGCGNNTKTTSSDSYAKNFSSEDNTKTTEQQTEKTVVPGDIIVIGSYYTGVDVSGGKSELGWYVLDVQDDKALVLAADALDCQKYHEDHSDVTWETCTLRNWLNNEFYNEAFSSEEQNKIITTNIIADANPECDTDPGNNTQDKIFLLSINEYKLYKKFFPGFCDTTYYAAARGALYEEKFVCSCWWLRNPGEEQDKAARVMIDDTEIISYRGDTTLDYIGVRPAMWIYF